MSPRITMNITADGEFELWLNEEGRDLLVRELQRLDERHEHFHLGALDPEIRISTRAYRSTDAVLDSGKVMFRTDEWDRKFFPQVMDEPA